MCGSSLNLELNYSNKFSLKIKKKGYPLERSDLDLLEVNLEIAAITAQFHSLDMPFIKQPNWLFDTTAKYIYLFSFFFLFYKCFEIFLLQIHESSVSTQI